MSTKSTLAHGDTFHFYNEVLDDDHVYLEVRGVQFEAGHGRVMIPIPMHIWETIRHLGAAELDLIDKTDSELLAMVEAEVDRRIEEFQTSKSNDPKRTSLLRFLGSLPYGLTDVPREEQIQRGLEYHLSQRRRQREIHEAIVALRASQVRRLNDGEV
jgi:hypothetical protein